jgi:hypothetical protein
MNMLRRKMHEKKVTASKTSCIGSKENSYHGNSKDESSIALSFSLTMLSNNPMVANGRRSGCECSGSVHICPLGAKHEEAGTSSQCRNALRTSTGHDEDADNHLCEPC